MLQQLNKKLDKKLNRGLKRQLISYLITIACSGIAASLAASPAHSQTYAQTYINRRVCPKDLPSLGLALAKDLPDYLNRSYQRLWIKREVLAIGQIELEPLALAPDQPRDRLPEQMFFSALEKNAGSRETSQRAYWLFLVPTSRGWRLSMAFMRVGQAPPVDVSDAAIADATNKWLRDYCDPRYPMPNS